MTMTDAALELDKTSGFLLLPVKEIYPDPEFNCRGQFTANEIIELAMDVAKRGLLQPVTVRELWDTETTLLSKGYKYFLVSGFRRLSAYKANETELIPANIRVIKSEFECRDINAVENLQRSELSYYQEARSIRHYWLADWTREDIARRVSKSPGWVQQRIMLLEMEPDIQNAAQQGYILCTDVMDLKKLSGPERLRAAGRIRDLRRSGNKSRNVMIRLPKKLPPNQQKIRHKEEIEKLMDDLREYFRQIPRDGTIAVPDLVSEQGNTVFHRILAWSVGNITNVEVHIDLRNFFDKFGVKYEMPDFDFRVT